MKKKILKAFCITVLAMIVFCALGFASIALDWSSKEALIKSISYWTKKSDINEHRNYIFCGTLKPGMDRETVLEMLQQFGEFTYNEFYWGSSNDEGYSEIAIHYLDEQIAGRDSVMLTFEDGKYLGANTIVFLDTTRPLCQ